MTKDEALRKWPSLTPIEAEANASAINNDFVAGFRQRFDEAKAAYDAEPSEANAVVALARATEFSRVKRAFIDAFLLRRRAGDRLLQSVEAGR
jgi:hypothetical protein